MKIVEPLDSLVKLPAFSNRPPRKLASLIRLKVAPARLLKLEPAEFEPQVVPLHVAVPALLRVRVSS